MLTQTELRELLHYDPATGVFRWRVDRGGTAKAGTVAGNIQVTGYVYISIHGKRYRANRLAWFYMTGEWPSGMVDHEDRDRANNRWKNLREATRGQNRANSRPNRNGLGMKGVSRHRDGFQAQINFKGKKVYLGVFDTAKEAAAIYALAARDLHGEFARP